MTKWQIIGIAGGALVLLGAILAYFAWPARRPVRDEMAAVPDDHPHYEYEPTAYTDLPLADQALFHGVHRERLDDGWDEDYPHDAAVVVEPAALVTATGRLRQITGRGYDPGVVHEGEIVDTGWYPPVARTNVPALPMETTVPAWIGWNVESALGDPLDGHTGHTGAFRWGSDGRLVPVSQLIAELDREQQS